ncbi:hypothetical protein BJ742DRAFT_54295 [Cladochytrium replicatum]|nr:hypothetical protein BJ742DRAFT_54295 [Cladochytrium replicatum]
MGRTHPVALRLRTLVNWPSNVRHAFISSYVKHIFQQNMVGVPGIRASTMGIWVNVTVFSAGPFSHPKVPTLPAEAARASQFSKEIEDEGGAAEVTEAASSKTAAPSASSVSVPEPEGHRPKLSSSPAYIEFRNVDLTQALGRFETRVRNLSLKEGKVDYYLGPNPEASTKPHPYYYPLLSSISAPSVMSAAAFGPNPSPEKTLEALQIFKDVPIHLRVNVISNPILNAEVFAQFVAKQLKGGRPMMYLQRNILQKIGVNE